MNYCVYLHLCPITKNIRYVGKGVLERATSFYQRKAHHGNWIKSLKNKGLKPLVIFLEVGLGESEALDLEKLKIKEFRDAGLNLTNSTDGGEGVSGFKPTQQQREANSKRMSGTKNPNFGKRGPGTTCHGKIWTTEQRKKLSLAKKGHPTSEETKLKISAAQIGKKIPRDIVEKIAAKLRGRPSPLKGIPSGRPGWNKGLDKALQPRFGKLHKDETKKKMSESAYKRTYTEEQLNVARLNGKKRSRAISCSNGMEFESVITTARYFNTKTARINEVLSCKKKAWKGLVFNYKNI